MAKLGSPPCTGSAPWSSSAGGRPSNQGSAHECGDHSRLCSNPGAACTEVWCGESSKICFLKLLKVNSLEEKHMYIQQIFTEHSFTRIRFGYKNLMQLKEGRGFFFLTQEYDY